MTYYRVLGLAQEPFSTSPDPHFFYETRGHKTAITNLIIELRLRRGLSVVLGDIGTGKTTLGRKLVQSLKNRDGFVFYLLLDPTYESEYLFLGSLVRLFGIKADINGMSILDLKSDLERFLFQKGVEENKTVVLIIDEAQKLDTKSLEVMRILLNYETNEYKLLQLVLLGQIECYARIVNIPNFMDRISFKYTLNPLDEEETRELIEFRLVQAGYQGKTRLFLDDAIKEIHHYTRGYPRQIARLCHNALKKLVVDNKASVDAVNVRSLIDEEVRSGWQPRVSQPLKSSY